MKKVTIVLLALIISSCGQDDLFVPVSGKVISAENQNPIQDAKVIYNATESYFTDEYGEFYAEFNLNEFLADSIAFYVERPGYHPIRYSTVVGNTQKDLILISLSPK